MKKSTAGEFKCLVCAWRGDCQKKFSMSIPEANACVDFSRDVSLKKEEPEDEESEKSEEKKEEEART